jgi:signal transduction histidine kinase
VITGRGKALMDDIQRIISEMQAEENTLLTARTDISNRSAQSTVLSAIVLTVFSCGFLAFAFLGLRRSESALETRVQERTAALMAATNAQQQLAIQHEDELRRQTILNNLSLALNSSASLDEVLNIAVAQLNRELDGSSASIFLLGADNRTLKGEATIGFDGESPAGMVFDISTLEHTLRATQTHLLAYFTISDASPIERTHFTQMNFAAALVIPLFVPERLIGVAYVNYNEQRPAPSPVQIEFARNLANQCALAINKAYLLAEHQRLLEEVKVRADELEMRVRERTSELEEANRHKSQFLAHMSHELRTPLNSILGYTTILLQGLPGPLNEEQTKQLDMVRNSGRQLLTLINGLLDIARIEAGKTEVNVEHFNLMDKLHLVLDSVRPMAEQKGLPLILTVEPALEKVIMYTDRLKVRQILLNLLSNAVKFTDKGQIELLARRADDSVEFQVIDTGIGIKPTHVSRLFQEFGQVHTPGRVKQEGSGLGLILTQRLVELLHGSIRVTSKEGEGTTFTVTLPISLMDAGK